MTQPLLLYLLTVIIQGKSVFMSADNDSAAQLVRQGEQARKQGDFNEAFNLFNQALKLTGILKIHKKNRLAAFTA